MNPYALLSLIAVVAVSIGFYFGYNSTVNKESRAEAYELRQEAAESKARAESEGREKNRKAVFKADLVQALEEILSHNIEDTFDRQYGSNRFERKAWTEKYKRLARFLAQVEAKDEHGRLIMSLKADAQDQKAMLEALKEYQSEMLATMKIYS